MHIDFSQGKASATPLKSYDIINKVNAYIYIRKIIQMEYTIVIVLVLRNY
jgi:hypothetical protein